MWPVTCVLVNYFMPYDAESTKITAFCKTDTSTKLQLVTLSYYIITHPIDLSGANKLRSFLQYSQEKNIC